MKPHISVVAAVRGRVALLQAMLDSLVATADQPDRVEVILRCDYDDAPLIDFLRARSAHQFIVGPRVSGYASLPAFANEAARLAHADLVIVVNDDAEFQTPGWDTKLVAHAARYPDGLFVLGVETLNAKNFVFPCVSRTHIELFGGVFEDRLVYPDIWTRDVYQPFDRAVRIHDVKVAHHWQGMSADQRQALGVAQSGEHHALYTQCVNEGRAKISALLGVTAC